MVLKLRQVQSEDCYLLWRWANEPGVRSESFCSAPIPLHEHLYWFVKKQSDKYCKHYIVLNEQNTHLGQVRFDIINDDAIINISIDSRFRGFGYGTQAIILSVIEMFNTQEIKRIIAYVKLDNRPSLVAFKKANFQVIEETEINGHRAVCLAFLREEAICKE